jgi:cyclophilin family peptidyl-prolyl cis-trans isomerase
MKANLIFLVVCGVLVCGGCPAGAPYVESDPRVRVSTTLGEFVIEVNQAKAPNTVQNFLQYVQDGFYGGTIFHRVIPGFVVQGGGFSPGMQEKTARAPIASEANNGLKNLRGTVAMARTDAPNSATAQFFVNLTDNAALDATLTSPGYTVFGSLVEGLDVIDQIAAVPTGTQGDFSDVPVTDVVIQSTTVEPGAQVLSSAWATYLGEYGYSAGTQLRDAAVQILGTLIKGR